MNVDVKQIFPLSEVSEVTSAVNVQRKMYTLPVRQNAYMDDWDLEYAKMDVTFLKIQHSIGTI